MALLSRSKFSSVNVQSERYDAVYGSAEEWWRFLLTQAPRESIMGMEEEARARFKEEYLERLRPMVDAGGLHISIGVIYAIARR